MREANVLKLVMTAIGMTALGLLLGIAGGFIGAHTANPAGFEALGAAIFGLIVGYIAGAIIGLILLKYTVHLRGSVLRGTLAAAVWTVVSIGVLGLMNRAHDASSAVVVIVFLLIPTVALLGFRLKTARAS